MLRDITTFAIVIIVFGSLLGLTLARTEIFSPSIANANARRIEVETYAAGAKYRDEAQLRQIELEARRALHQQELDFRERRARFFEAASVLAAKTLSISIILLAFGGSIFFVCAGFARLWWQLRESERSTLSTQSSPLEELMTTAREKAGRATQPEPTQGKVIPLRGKPSPLMPTGSLAGQPGDAA